MENINTNFLASQWCALLDMIDGYLETNPADPRYQEKLELIPQLLAVCDNVHEEIQYNRFHETESFEHELDLYAEIAENLSLSFYCNEYKTLKTKLAALKILAKRISNKIKDETPCANPFGEDLRLVLASTLAELEIPCHDPANGLKRLYTHRRSDCVMTTDYQSNILVNLPDWFNEAVQKHLPRLDHNIAVRHNRALVNLGYRPKDPALAEAHPIPLETTEFSFE